MRILVRLLIVSLLAAATSLQAITYIVPTDRDLVKRAEAIVIATAVESHPEIRDGGRIVTVATLQVERAIKGLVAGESVELVEMGGAVGDRAILIPGSPRYEPGKRYLVFLRTNKFGERVTYGFGLGRFEFTSDIAGRQLLTRGSTNDEVFGFEESDWSPHVERLRSATEFMNFVETVAKADGPAREDYLLDRSSVVLATFPEFGPRATRFIPIAESTRPDYMLAGNYRWPSPSATFVYCCAPTFEPGFNGPSDISSAMSNWNGASAGVNYTLGAVDNSANKGFTASDCKNAVLFNDPNNEITGAAAIGGISTTGTTCTPPPGQPSGPFTYSLPDGITYNKTLEVDVVVGKSISTNETTFIGVLTHELGHTLGFRHADGTSDPLSPQNGHPCVAPAPCAGQGSAVMASVIAFNLSTLQQWDLDAAQTVYGNGPVCTPPSIGTQPANTSITNGQQTTLSVAATGTSLTYQWYIGSSGTTTTPAPNGTGTQLTVSPSTTTNYWVRVTGQCAPVANSRTAIVTVTCAPPSVPAPLASPSSIASGQSSILSVSPMGTGPFTYQWYVGSSGVTANPINGATSLSTTVSPATTTSFWVRVTGQCAPVADSPSTTVTVAACVPPSAPAPLASPSSISVGQSSNLSISATGTGPFTYQWFVGSSGNESNPIAGATGSFTTVSPAVTTSYWVKVTGQCAPASNSPATTVTVACTPIVSGGVTAQPQTINVGQSSTIFVTTSGSGPFTFQWFRGSLGDASNPIAGATGSNTIVSPVTSTTYWVRVTAPCGSQDGSITVFVNAPCTASSITTHPAFATIAPGASATLTVVAAGTAPIFYQWFTGTSGNTANPIAGATNASVTVSPSVTTSYWVRVSNSCNQTGNNSTTAVVTVSVACPAPAITTQPASVSAGLGTAATLKVVATVTGTTIHYQWYKGAKGDLSTKVGTDSDTFTTGAVSVTASYWVRLTSACNPLTFIDSNAAIVTATAAARARAVKFGRD
jgi:hypothetical protein